MTAPSPEDATRPSVSVVIPARNAVATLGMQLAALASQTFTEGFEVLVSDNGSTDGTQALVERHRALSAGDGLADLRLVDSSDRPGPAHARNVGAAAATSDLLAFCDADDIAHPGWLSGLFAASRTSPLVAGRIDSDTLNDERSRRWRPAVADVDLPISHGFLPYAFGANFSIRRDVFVELGGFNETYPYGEDVELVWRAQLQGQSLAFAADATMHYRYRPGLRSLLRQYFRYGTIGPRLYRDFRGAGMPPSTLRGAVGPWTRLLCSLPFALTDEARRGDVLRRLAYRAGRVAGSWSCRVVYL